MRQRAKLPCRQRVTTLGSVSSFWTLRIFGLAWSHRDASAPSITAAQRRPEPHTRLRRSPSTMVHERGRHRPIAQSSPLDPNCPLLTGVVPGRSGHHVYYRRSACSVSVSLFVFCVNAPPGARPFLAHRSGSCAAGAVLSFSCVCNDFSTVRGLRERRCRTSMLDRPLSASWITVSLRRPPDNRLTGLPGLWPRCCTSRRPERCAARSPGSSSG